MTQRSPRPPTSLRGRRRVVCLGNDIAGDDGAGLAVGRALAAMELPAGVEVELAGRLELEFLETLRPDDGLLLVDAVEMGEPPGSCRIMELAADGLAAPAHPAPAHGLELAGLLQLGRRLCPGRMPRRLELLGIQAARLDQFDEALSPEVAAAIPRAVAISLEWAGVEGG